MKPSLAAILMLRLVTIACALATLDLSATELLDPELPEYVPAVVVSGQLNVGGSDSLNNLMTFWAEGFHERHPETSLEIVDKGGTTAFAALDSDKAQIGMAARLLSDAQLATLTTAWGHPPVAIVVAIDALAVVVHGDNPIPSLSMQQVDAIFSSTFKRGGTSVTTWGEVGLAGDWTTRALAPVGRNSASGTYGFFKMVALMKGDYKTTVFEVPGSSQVVQRVASDLGSIGYAGLGYLTDGVRAVPLIDDQGVTIAPTAQSALDLSYPLSRHLYLYVKLAPANPEPLLLEFLRFVLSKPGQEMVVKDGYIPLSASLAAQQRASD